jgi:hypothetical protein
MVDTRSNVLLCHNYAAQEGTWKTVPAIHSESEPIYDWDSDAHVRSEVSCNFCNKPGIDDWTCKIRLVFQSLMCRVRRVTRVYWLFGTWYFWISGQCQQWKSYVTTSQIFVSVTGDLHVTMCISFHTGFYKKGNVNWFGAPCSLIHCLSIIVLAGDNRTIYGPNVMCVEQVPPGIKNRSRVPNILHNYIEKGTEQIA